LKLYLIEEEKAKHKCDLINVSGRGVERCKYNRQVNSMLPLQVSIGIPEARVSS
jgi:hypothetical protein